MFYVLCVAIAHMTFTSTQSNVSLVLVMMSHGLHLCLDCSGDKFVLPQ